MLGYGQGIQADREGYSEVRDNSWGLSKRVKGINQFIWEEEHLMKNWTRAKKLHRLQGNKQRSEDLKSFLTFPL